MSQCVARAHGLRMIRPQGRLQSLQRLIKQREALGKFSIAGLGPRPVVRAPRPAPSLIRQLLAPTHGLLEIIDGAARLFDGQIDCAQGSTPAPGWTPRRVRVFAARYDARHGRSRIGGSTGGRVELCLEHFGTQREQMRGTVLCQRRGMRLRQQDARWRIVARCQQRFRQVQLILDVMGLFVPHSGSSSYASRRVGNRLRVAIGDRQQPAVVAHPAPPLRNRGERALMVDGVLQ